MKWLSAILAVIILPVLLMAAVSEGAQKELSGTYDQSLRKGETRATLDPGKFNDARVKAAYQAAREIPWVLDSIYCFCMCKESPTFRHKSLLSCYVDNHASV